jgi:outer membrane protein TolC
MLVLLLLAPALGRSQAPATPPGPAAAPAPARGAVRPATAVPAPRPGPRYTLKELLEVARRGNGQVQAGAARIRSAEATLLKARLAWVPNASLSFAYTPMPEIRCVVPESFRNVTLTTGGSLYDALYAEREKFCLGTDTSDNVSDYFRNFDPRGYWVRFDLSLVQPIYTFGKIENATRLARLGVAASREEQRVAGLQLEQDVRRAYFGLKLAREILFTVDEGQKVLRQAEKQIEEAIAKGSADVDLTDRYRFQIMKSEVDELIIQVKQGERQALAALRALVGAAAGADLDVDEAPLEAAEFTVRPLAEYQDLASRSRPEHRLLDLATRAADTLVALRKSQFAPDLVFVLRYRAIASGSKDDPQSAYLNDPLHGNGLYLGLGLKWDLDFHFKYADLAKARAERDAAVSLRRYARSGIALQVEKAYEAVQGATDRVTLLRKTTRAAKSWMVTMSLRHEVGTASTKDLTDALKAYFQIEMKRHQAVSDLNLALAELSRMVGRDVVTAWPGGSPGNK